MFAEFIRNVRIEMTWAKLIGMPAILLFLLLGGGILQSFETQSEGFFKLPSIATFYRGYLPDMIDIIMFSLLAVWGAKQASESIIDEVVGGTWDFQRMSGASPSGIVIGKLFGSTVFVWYGAILCTLAGLFIGKDPVILAALSISGLHSQVTAMLVAMLIMRIQPRDHRLRAPLAQMVGIAVAISFLIITSKGGWWRIWIFGQSFNIQTFALMIQTSIIIWTLWGVSRFMRLEFQVPTIPWVWGIFTLFTASAAASMKMFAYSAGGFSPIVNEYFWMFRMLAALYVIVILTVAAAFFEPKDYVRTKRFAMELTRNGLKSLFKKTANMPAWIVSYVMGMILAIAFVIFWFALDLESQDGRAMWALVIALMSFITRDILVLYALGQDPRQGPLTGAFYLSLSYALLPEALRITGNSWWLFVLWPSAPDSADIEVVKPIWAAIAPLAQAIIAGFVAYRILLVRNRDKSEF